MRGRYTEKGQGKEKGESDLKRESVRENKRSREKREIEVGDIDKESDRMKMEVMT